MTVLFDRGELASKLQIPSVDNATADLAGESAEAWLQDATGLSVWPSPLPLRLKHWALDLAAIVYNNPTMAASELIDDYRVAYEDRARVESILKRARNAFNTAGRPQYAFPEPDWSWTSVATSALAD